jgi:hypothetical protein
MGHDREAQDCVALFCLSSEQPLASGWWT